MQGENDDERRFKLRNGREVFEEKAYPVGVARKGYTDGSFGTEDSLSELEQLADTAGLLVVGSTCQKQGGRNQECNPCTRCRDSNFRRRAFTRATAELGENIWWRC